MEQRLDISHFGRNQNISTAPRDGTLIRVFDAEESHVMRWNSAGHNPLVQNAYERGIWEAPNREYTWLDGEFGPKYWCPVAS